MSPFTPHFSEHIWQNILGESSSIQSARFPAFQDVDTAVLQQSDYMRSVVDNLRSAEANAARRKGKAKTVFDPSKAKSARIYVATAFPEWQDQCLAVVKAAWDGKTFDDAQLRKGLEAVGLMKDKRAMPFCQQFKVGDHFVVADSSAK
jgi:leucyl-tRNA synthetase